MTPVLTSPYQYTCKDFYEIGFYSHLNCFMWPYEGPSYCMLPIIDKLKMVYVGFESWKLDPWKTFLLTFDVFVEAILQC